MTGSSGRGGTTYIYFGIASDAVTMSWFYYYTLIRCTCMHLRDGVGGQGEWRVVG